MVGVCSWSLQPANPADLAEKLRALGVSAVQLALDPLRSGAWDLRETAETLARAGVTIRSGMARTVGEDYSTLQTIEATGGVRADAHWHENLAAFAANATIARQLGIRLVSFHAGFLPEQRSDPRRATMVERLQAVVDCLAGQGIASAFETGQERAETLLDTLAQIDRPQAGVNFDPANMILYGMGDPIAALRKLLPRVRQVHIKDANPSAAAGAWGREQPVGRGALDWPAFFDVLRGSATRCDLMIEREAGGSRLDDIRAACALIPREFHECE